MNFNCAQFYDEFVDAIMAQKEQKLKLRTELLLLGYLVVATNRRLSMRIGLVSFLGQLLELTGPTIKTFVLIVA